MRRLYEKFMDLHWLAQLALVAGTAFTLLVLTDRNALLQVVVVFGTCAFIFLRLVHGRPSRAIAADPDDRPFFRKIASYGERIATAHLSDAFVEQQYVTAGCSVGALLSKLHAAYVETPVEWLDLEDSVAKLEKWERIYAHRGYRTMHVSAFVRLAASEDPLPSLGIKRADGEPPVLYAETFRAWFLERMHSASDLAQLQRFETQLDPRSPPVDVDHVYH